jgi:putative oxidoreductase
VNAMISSACALVGRLMLAFMFVYAGYGKVGRFDGTVANIGSKSLPVPEVLAAATIVLEVIAGVMLALGWKTRWAALALAVFTVIASVLFHNFWDMPVEQFRTQQLFFLKNMAAVGGLLMVVAFGAGRWSVDRR